MRRDRRFRTYEELAYPLADKTMLQHAHAVRLGGCLQSIEPLCGRGRLMPKDGKTPIELIGRVAVVQSVNGRKCRHDDNLDSAQSFAPPGQARRGRQDAGAAGSAQSFAPPGQARRGRQDAGRAAGMLNPLLRRGKPGGGGRKETFVCSSINSNVSPACTLTTVHGSSGNLYVISSYSGARTFSSGPMVTVVLRVSG